MGTQSASSTTPYDLIILGASGFAGKYVIKEALKFLNIPSSPLKKLALAGRSSAKVAQALNWAVHPNPQPPSVSILTADITNTASISHLCTQTKLIINCAGPYWLYGEPVLAACVEAGCDYLDLSGEPEFIERMEMKYHADAMEMGSLVMSASGFESVVAELGSMFNSRQWVSAASPYEIQSYLILESDKRNVLNIGTYESGIVALSNAERYHELLRSRPKRAMPVIPGPNTPPKTQLIKHLKDIGLWAVIVPSPDTVIVRKTISTLAENPHGLPGANENPEQIKNRETFWSTVKPSHFSSNLGCKTPLGLLRYLMIGIIMALLSRIAVGRWLLLKFPSFFTLGWFRKTGPSEDEVTSARFKMWFVGRGFSDVNSNKVKPDMEIVTRVMGPEIGYVATSIIIVQCALVLLSDRNNLPKGGVFSPGSVFGPTDLQQRLQQNGISFDVISKRSIPA